MKSTNHTAAKADVLTAADINAQAQSLFAQTSAWLTTHWLQVIIAVAAASLIVAFLHFVRRLGNRLCERRPGPAGWGTVFGRAIV
jgi:hypothetical protein